MVQQGWEFFTYRFGSLSGPACFIRVVAVADINNGNIHPNLTRENQGEWAVLRFRTSSACSLSGKFCPVSWFWLDCTDNIVSDSTGDARWVADSLYSADGTPIDLRTTFPNDVSACTTSSLGGPSAKRFVNFLNGGVRFPIDDEGICGVGDLNLNGLGYEIADYLLFKNFFLYGDSILSSDSALKAEQIQNSDVNRDSLTLRVSDLVRLVRVITGDANPLPEPSLSSFADTAEFTVARSGDKLVVSLNTPKDIGGIFLHLAFTGTVGTPIKLDSLENLELSSNILDRELRVLLTSVQKGVALPSGNRFLFLIPFSGDLESIEFQASTYSGQEMAAVVSMDVLCQSGDLNFNGIAYENPDYLAFANYFLYGDSALSSDSLVKKAQICNSDINEDSFALRISDLVLLVRIVTGDTNFLPSIPPLTAEFQIVQEIDRLIITASSSKDIGGIFLHLTFSGSIGTPLRLEAARNLDLGYQIYPGELRLLLSPSQQNDKILASSAPVLSIPLNGSVGKLSIQASTYQGQEMTASAVSGYTPTAEIPGNFALSQNFPNPFNPFTSFTLSFPKPSGYVVKIFNLAGQVVKSFSGEVPAGNKTFTWDGTDQNGVLVSSGIYFYKAEVGDFVQAKKMLFVK